MIDLHCHLLPDVDDGPANWQEALELAQCLVGEGITTVAATPHSYAHKRHHRYNPLHITKLVKEANRRFQGEGLTLRVVPGTEILLGGSVLERLEAGHLLCYGDTQTILLEASIFIEPDELTQGILSILDRGYGVVFAHPEKVHAVGEDPNLLLHLIERGVLIQVNASNLAGLHGSAKMDLSRKLVLHGMVQVVASDAHGVEGPRRPAIQEGYSVVRQLIGSEVDDLFTSIPERIIRGDTLPAFEVRPIQS